MKIKTAFDDVPESKVYETFTKILHAPGLYDFSNETRRKLLVLDKRTVLVIADDLLVHASMESFARDLHTRYTLTKGGVTIKISNKNC